MLGSCITVYLTRRSSMIREMSLVLSTNKHPINELVFFSISILIYSVISSTVVEITVNLIVIVCWRKCARERAFRKARTINVIIALMFKSAAYQTRSLYSSVFECWLSVLHDTCSRVANNSAVLRLKWRITREELP